MPVVSIGPFEVAAGAFALLLALIAVSFLVEALRRAPRPPERLAWAPDTPVHYVDLDGVKVRFIKAGSGPNLVLLHTLRTQLDLFAKVVPDLAKAFTVYAIDYSGHGYSDIPPARYDAGFFARFVGRFLEALDLGEVTLCGVSIGGAVSLILAGRGHSRVARVIAVNPYDYAKGRGTARSSSLGLADDDGLPGAGLGRDLHAAAAVHHHAGCTARWRGEPREHFSCAHEGDVLGRPSSQSLPRVRPPAPPCRELGSGDGRHQGSGVPDLGRPGLVPAERARASSRLHSGCADRHR